MGARAPLVAKWDSCLRVGFTWGISAVGGARPLKFILSLLLAVGRLWRVGGRRNGPLEDWAAGVEQAGGNAPTVVSAATGYRQGLADSIVTRGRYFKLQKVSRLRCSMQGE